MATKAWFLRHGICSNVHHQLREADLGAEETTTPNYGWTVGLLTPPQFAYVDAQTELTTAAFSATEPTSGVITTAAAGNCWRTPVPLSGTFATGDWTVEGQVIAVTLGSGQDGRIKVRLFKSANSDGSSATELTSAAQTGSTVTNLTTIASQGSVVTFNLNSFTVTDEYLFVQVLWEITGAAAGHAATVSDVIFRVGGGVSTVVSPDFTQTTTQTATAEAMTMASVNSFPSQIAWANAANGAISDGDVASYSSTTIVIEEESENLRGTNYGFSIPTTATITGIKVEFDRNTTVSGGISDVAIQLVVGGTATGDNKSAAAAWPTTLTIATFGGASDLWGLTPTPAQVNATDFGAQLRCQNNLGSSEVARVDQFRITVYYTNGTPSRLMLLGVGP